MLDFNHRPKFHEQLCGRIDQALVAERKAQARRAYLGGSRLGASCERALQYEYAGAAVDEGKSLGGPRLRIFEVGHAFEAVVIRWLRLAGLRLLTIELDNQQFGFSVAGGQIQGHCDGFVIGGPSDLMAHSPIRYPMLLEIKSMADGPFKECKKKGVSKAKPVYAAQMALYQAYLHDALRLSHPDLQCGLSDNPALFAAVNKDTQELWFEFVPFDGSLAQRMSDRGVRVVRATEAGELLPRAFADAHHVDCKTCAWTQRCWSVTGTPSRPLPTVSFAPSFPQLPTPHVEPQIEPTRLHDFF